MKTAVPPRRPTAAPGGPDGPVIGLIGALLVGAGRGGGHLDLQDDAGAIQVALTPEVECVRFDGASRYRGLTGQFSGAIRPTAVMGVSQYALEYSDPECCGSTMSFTVDDSTGEILSVAPPESDAQDKISLPKLVDTERCQAADDARYLEQNQVGP